LILLAKIYSQKRISIEAFTKFQFAIIFVMKHLFKDQKFTYNN